MGLITDFLTLPVLGSPRLVHWLARVITEQLERESLDEGRVLSELMELQQRYDAGEVDEEQYDQQEKALLERLNLIREFKARQGRPGQSRLTSGRGR